MRVLAVAGLMLCSIVYWKTSIKNAERCNRGATSGTTQWKNIAPGHNIHQWRKFLRVTPRTRRPVRDLCKTMACPLYQKCGTQNRTRYIDISKLASSWARKSDKVLLDYMLSLGCDPVSAFAGRGKLSALSI
ncbi:hypothetical protein KUCAC02_004058 [Chaenocephalus aceratus]|uniref:Uncharacterized protein n=1 Tax=Chaenocephalus aceratus TaxID=36190 RepID=A0ACB9WZ26_CHAAC|nr:hypothetical protein KUCAC02_004058 [Chaenocephalus aceratus]